MAQSSNYKNYTRQVRTLTEETAFAGGMLWTGNNIGATNLKTIVNFNYDDTTGFLKTRAPLKPIEVDNGGNPVGFLESIRDNQGGKAIVADIAGIEGLYDKKLIGVYNMCYTDTFTDPWTQSRAGWLYLFGSVTNTEVGYETCDEASLVWLYLDDENHWHALHPAGAAFGGQLVSDTGIRPILYDNVLYCTNADTTEAFYAYRIFKTLGVMYNSETKTNVYVNKFCVCKQAYTQDDNPIDDEMVSIKHYYSSMPPIEDSTDPANPTASTVFDNTAKELVDSVTLLEATATGFNGLRGKEMYTYSSTVDETGDKAKHITGAYFKDKSGNICVSPRLGQLVELHVILDNVPTKNAGKVMLSKLTQGTVEDANAVWELIETEDAGAKVFFDCTVTEEAGTYNIVWLSADSEDATRFDGMILNCTTNKLNTQLRLKEYAVPTAKGSCLWNTHLVLWDTVGSSNSLFISETENFYYMPVPNNVAMFETDIISCIPYMGDLLVFTSDRVYRLIESNDGTFTQEVVQNNMPLAREDAAYIRAVKNMVFFKSGNYYYMIVPKSQSLTGELTVAPIYKNIAGWFDDPSKATKEILTQMYPEHQYNDVETVSGRFNAAGESIKEARDAITVSAPRDIYVEQDTVTILYDVEAWYTTTKPAEQSIHGHTLQYTDPDVQTFALFVNYNTNLRAWTMYLEDTTRSKLYPATLTASRNMSFVRVCADDTGGTMDTMYLSTMQESSEPADGVRCLIDTGYRTLSNVLKKRFREVQLKLYNPTENITTFGSAFFVDGSVRRNYTHLEPVLLPGDSGYVSLAPVYDPNTFLIESTMSVTDIGDTIIGLKEQGSDSIELSDWTLDFSHFKRGAPSTIRIPVSGKGYAPRLVLMSPKCIALHLNELNWVYRIMNGR